MKKLEYILLIDDDEENNFIHKMIIKGSGVDARVESVVSVRDAINCLISGNQPDLIFLDINMPVLTGWDFLNEYRNLTLKQKVESVIIMLTSSLHSEDEKKARSFSEISEYKTKHLTIPLFKHLVNKYFDEGLK